MSPADIALICLIGLMAVGAAWQALVPLRANIAARQGDLLVTRGDGVAALKAYDKATNLRPDDSLYWVKKGQLFQRASPPQPRSAQKAYLEAVDVNPYEIGTLNGLAALAEREGDLVLSRRLYQQAVDVDPVNPETLVAASTFELRHSGAESARQTLERAVQQLPEQAALWATLGDARAVLGDLQGARQAYRRALELDPRELTASLGLDKLRG